MPKMRNRVMTGGGSTAVAGYAFVGEENVVATTPTAPTGTVPGLTPTGYISSDGLTLATDSSAEAQRDFAGTVIKMVQSENGADTLQFRIVQYRDAQSLSLIYGADNVTVDPSTGVIRAKSKGRLPAPRSYVFDVNDPESGNVRIFIPVGKVTEIGETKFSTAELVGIDITLTCLHDETLGATYELIMDGDPVTP